VIVIDYIGFMCFECCLCCSVVAINSSFLLILIETCTYALEKKHF
jgi:hypothetical protein